MTNHEMKLVSRFLSDLGEHMGSAGCNDFELPDTPDNRQLLEEIERWAAGYPLDTPAKDVPDYRKPKPVNGKLQTYDWMVVGLLQSKIEAETI